MLYLIILNGFCKYVQATGDKDESGFLRRLEDEETFATVAKGL